MDYDDDDNFYYITINNPVFINYNPSYYIPEDYYEFLTMHAHMFLLPEYEEINGII